MTIYAASILKDLPMIQFFDGDKIILRKGGSLFGKSGPVKVAVRPSMFALLEFFRVCISLFLKNSF